MLSKDQQDEHFKDYMGTNTEYVNIESNEAIQPLAQSLAVALRKTTIA